MWQKLSTGTQNPFWTSLQIPHTGLMKVIMGVIPGVVEEMAWMVRNVFYHRVYGICIHSIRCSIYLLRESSFTHFSWCLCKAMLAFKGCTNLFIENQNMPFAKLMLLNDSFIMFSWKVSSLYHTGCRFTCYLTDWEWSMVNFIELDTGKLWSLVLN